jgi:hypothetical protein
MKAARIWLFLGVLTWITPGAHAGEWLCEEASSVRTGDEVLACGVGEGPTEEVARNKALVAAQLEFMEICGSSDDCKGRKSTSVPLRTTCTTPAPGTVKCYRGLRYEITGEAQPVAIFNEANREALRAKREALEEELRVLAAVEAERAEVERLEKAIREKDFQGAAVEAPAKPLDEVLILGIGGGFGNLGSADLKGTLDFHLDYDWRLGSLFSFGVHGAYRMFEDAASVSNLSACVYSCTTLRTEERITKFSSLEAGTQVLFHLNQRVFLGPTASFAQFNSESSRVSYGTSVSGGEAVYATDLGKASQGRLATGLQLAWHGPMTTKRPASFLLLAHYQKYRQAKDQPSANLLSITLGIGGVW